MNTDQLLFAIVLFVFFAVLVSAIYYFFRYFAFKGDSATDDRAADGRAAGGLATGGRTSSGRTSSGRTTGGHATGGSRFRRGGVVKPVSLLTALHKTRKAWAQVQGLDQLEAALYGSDLGPSLIEHLMQRLQKQARPPYSFESLRPVLQHELLQVFKNHPRQEDLDLFAPLSKTAAATDVSAGAVASRPLQVAMIVGVNGAGKTTTLGRLAFQLTPKKTMLVAGDTFRAAADLQLQVWSERACATFFGLEKKPNKNLDPSAVVFEALTKAQHENFDCVLVDTAGRLHTQKNLMHELQKIKRTIVKKVHNLEVLLVADASQGQNVIQQGRQFHEALGLTGVVLTKLDGSSRGGCAVALWQELGVPLRAVGVGEGLQDLQTFNAQSFVNSLLAVG